MDDSQGTWTSKAGIVLIGLFSCTLAFAQTNTLDVKIIGIKGPVLDNVKAALYQDANHLKKHLTGKRIRQFIKRSPNNIQQSTAPFGYFKPTTKVTTTHSPNLWQVQFTIKLGQPIRIKKAIIKITGAGSNTEPFNKYLEQQQKNLKIGDNFNSENYSDAKNSLYNTAAEYGYFNAKIESSKAMIDLKNNTAKISIAFNTGERFSFGQTKIAPSYLAPSFLRRFLEYKPGAPFENSKLQTTQKHLNNSNFFTAANVDTKFDKTKNHTVPISIDLNDNKRFKYIFGGGYGTDTGVRAIVGADVRMVNRYGHSYSAQTEISKNTNFISLHYNIPGYDPGTETYTLHTLAGQEDYSSSIGSAKLIKSGVSYSDIIKTWDQTFDISALVENYKLKNSPPSKTTTIIPSVKWQKTIAKPLIMPNNGYNISLTISGAPITLFGYSKFIQFNAMAKDLFTIGRDTRIVSRANLIMTKIRRLNDLPLSLRPMAGGSQSIRGFDYNSIYNGRDLLVGSIAWQQRIYKTLYVEAFYDTGTVSDNLKGTYYTGVGPGLVWRTEIGAMSFTYAKAISPRGHWLFQFNIGPEI